MKQIKAGIVGGAGYTGGELLRLLLNHPHVTVEFIASTSQAGKSVAEVHTDLFGDTELKFSAGITQDIDVLFMCLGHGNSAAFLAENPIGEHIKIIDFSQDFRLKANAKGFVYGLPELNKQLIRHADFIANPGCFATAIQLALLPLAQQRLLPADVFISATTGSTGAGQGFSATTHFSWRANNMSVYKAFTHQHLAEIGESLTQLQPEFGGKLKFIPQRGDFTRGIFANIVLSGVADKAELCQIYREYYANHPFTHISPNAINLKQVINTNKCLISISGNGQDILINSTIDNLLKGASGQAVQNMNLMFGLDETAGLKLKALAF